MKISSMFCIGLICLGSLVVACQKDHVKLAKQYGKQLCIYNDYYSQRLQCKDSTEAEVLDETLEALQDDLNRINQQILEQYHGDEVIMAEIQQIIQSYECSTN